MICMYSGLFRVFSVYTHIIQKRAAHKCHRRFYPSGDTHSRVYQRIAALALCRMLVIWYLITNTASLYSR